jgi:hypothetical protein
MDYKFKDNYGKNFSDFIASNIPLNLIKFIKKGYTFSFYYLTKIQFRDRFIEWQKKDDKNTLYQLLLFIDSHREVHKADSSIYFVDQPNEYTIKSGDLFIIPNQEDFNFLINTNNVFGNLFVLVGSLELNETKFAVKSVEIDVPLIQEIEDNSVLYKTVKVQIKKGEGMQNAYHKIIKIATNSQITMTQFDNKFGHLFKEKEE